MLVNDDVDDTFSEIHTNYIGNGPIMTIASYLKGYALSRGYTMKSKTVYSISNVKTEIGNDRPIGTLLTAGPLDWHWVMTLGYREYTASDDFYLRVVNGWWDSANYFYLWDAGVWSATSYYIQ